MMLIHSNVNSMDESFFLKKIEVAGIYAFKKVIEKYSSTRRKKKTMKLLR